MSSSFLLRGSGGAQSSSRRSVPVVLRRLSSFLIIGTILLATIAHAPYATSAAPITRRAHVAVADRNDHPTMTQQSSSSSTTSTPPTATMLNELFSFVQQVISTDGQYSWLFGVFLAAMASIISNLGLTLQKLTHQRLATGYGSTRPFYYQPLWIVGISLVMFASIADVIALCFAPQSLIAPLGALTMVSNVVFAPLLLHEKIGVRDLIATAIILSGSVIAVIFGAHADQIYPISELFTLFRNTRFIAYAITVAICLLTFLIMLHKFAQQEEAHRNGQGEGLSELQRHWQRFAYPAIAGTIGAQSVLFAKCTVELIINTGRHQGNAFVHWETYLIMVCMFLTIFLQIKWLNDGLIRFDTSYIVPVFVSFWIVLSVMSGMIFFKEYTGMSWTQIWIFMLGVMFTVAGVILLSFRPIVATSSRGTNVFDAFDTHHSSAPPSRPRSRRASLDGIGSPFSPAVSTDREHLGLPPTTTIAQRRPIGGAASAAAGSSSLSPPTSNGSISRKTSSLGVDDDVHAGDDDPTLSFHHSLDASDSIDSSPDDHASLSRREQEKDAADVSEDENETLIKR